MTSGFPRRPLKDRLLERVSKNEVTGCWNWKGATIKSGSPTAKPLFYGVIGEGGSRENGAKTLLTHRASWMVHKGEIPDGMQVLHRCDNTRCVNPEHLFIGTRSDNMRDALRKGRMTQVWTAEKLAGDLSPRAKLTWKIVRKIRKDFSPGMGPRLAKRYGISNVHVHRIVRCIVWKPQFDHGAKP